RDRDRLVSRGRFGDEIRLRSAVRDHDWLAETYVEIDVLIAAQIDLQLCRAARRLDLVLCGADLSLSLLRGRGDRTCLRDAGRQSDSVVAPSAGDREVCIRNVEEDIAHRFHLDAR